MTENSNRQTFHDHSLSNGEILRYSRQLLLPDIGVSGQEKLKKSSVLVVGAGGLGCPVAMYLSATGIGRLGVVDYDSVEKSNLHRQVAHSDDKIGWNKARSLKDFCQKLNPEISIIAHEFQLTHENAGQLINSYDLVCDCSDNVPTRYLLNDACFLNGKPLVSGSALRWDGQLALYNHSIDQPTPCYRCLFPRPPPPQTVVGCSEGGVLGVVPGIIGNMQALEAIKLIVGIQSSLRNQLLIFDGLSGQFRYIKLRSKNPECALCGKDPSIRQLINYEQFCHMCACDKVYNVSLLSPSERISVEKLQEFMSSIPNDFLLIDCRPEIEFEICRLNNSVSLPWKSISGMNSEQLISRIKLAQNDATNKMKIAVVCRRGNDSQEAVIDLKKKLSDLWPEIVDVEGGLEAWAERIEHNFPRY